MFDAVVNVYIAEIQVIGRVRAVQNPCDEAGNEHAESWRKVIRVAHSSCELGKPDIAPVAWQYTWSL